MSSVYDYLKYCYNYDFQNLHILECGALNGEETMNFNTNNQCYYIEANPYVYLNLINKFKNIYFYALTNSIGQTQFTVTSWVGNSSINHSEEHRKELMNYGSSFENIQVPCITYKYFLENIIKNNIDILILDIEGHECTVLKTFYELKREQLPKFVIIECGYDWLDRKKILLELGYKIDFYQFNNCYLTLPDFIQQDQKNIENMQNINNENKRFIWRDYLIYENELV